MSGPGGEKKSEEIVIIRRRSGDGEGGHHGGVWKIAYADFMTAMMAFFLVMWLINSTDKKTLTQVATYFNPLRLTDKTPSARGLHQSETGAPQSKEDATGAGQQQSKGKAEGKDAKGEAKDAKSEGSKAEKSEGPKAEGAKQRFSEEMLFRDPYAALSKLAIQGEGEQRRAGGMMQQGGYGSAAGEAYRDPFEPAFRRTPPGDAPASAAAGAPPQAQPPADTPSQTPPQPQRQVSSGTEGGEARAPEAAPAAKGTPPAQIAEKAREAAAAAQLEAQIKHELAQTLRGAMPGIDVSPTEEGVLVSVTDDYDFGMFAIASAEPRPATVVIMEKLARVLAARPERLVVRGHTDGRPFKSGTYDNWRLSSARAHMAYYMLVRGGIDEKRFERVEGHADRSLRVADDPEASQNRRIEILLRKGKP